VTGSGYQGCEASAENPRSMLKKAAEVLGIRVQLLEISGVPKKTPASAGGVVGVLAHPSA